MVSMFANELCVQKTPEHGKKAKTLLLKNMDFWPQNSQEIFEKSV